MAGIKDYSTTNLNNTSLNGISVAEGMLPSQLNNAIRALMVNTREWFNDSQWVEYGDGDGAYTATYASATSFTIAGVDVTPIYHEGRRIKLTATTPGTIYGTISSSSFSTNTTINVTWDSGSLSNEAISNVYIGALSKTNNSLPTGVIATATLADGSVTTVKIDDSAVTTAKINDAAVTNAKLGADSVNGSKIADDSIDSEHYVDGSIDTQHIADSQITTAKIADSNVTTAKIADSNVTTAKIANSNVTTAKIADLNVTTGKIAADAVDGTKIADDSINSEHYVDGSIDTQHIADSQITTAKVADSNITTTKIADSNVTTAKIADSNITTAKINNDAVTADKIADAVIVTNAEQSGATPNDTTFFTTSASDARYFRQDSSETISSGDTWSASDSYIATTAAIDARVIDLVDDVGGFYPIANETSFPNTNPDVNDGAGTIISIKEIATTRTPTAGVVTISGGTLGGSTVTITGCGSTVLTAGFGVLVETSTTLNTYTFHRLVPKATEVTTVASISTAITNVDNNSTNINAVNANSANINTVAGLNTEITNLNNIRTDITGVNNIAGDVTAVNNNSANINTVAGLNTEIAALGASGTVASINTVASNISGVNSFAERYRVETSDPTLSLDEGDLVFNTTDNNLKFYNGTSWTSIAPGLANVADDTTPQLGGNLDLNSNNITGTGNVNITGNVSLTGTVDGRDIASDGTKLDTIATNATANPNAIDNVVEDTTPQLGGNLDLNSSNITGTGNVNITGSVTATSFAGDGSALTGLSSGSGTPAAGDLSTGIFNVALSADALTSIQSTANFNTGIGSYSLRSLTTGDYNTAVGYRSGVCITTGTDNTILGQCAGTCITTGTANVAIGNTAMSESNNKTGNYNIAVGYGASAKLSTGLRNVAIGHYAGCAITTGSCNITIGCSAGCGITTGGSNIAIGCLSMQAAATAANGHNIAIGEFAGNSITTAVCNVFIGHQAGRFSEQTCQNTAIGTMAMCRLQGGSSNHRNVAIGFAAFTGCGQSGANPTIQHNTFVGSCAGPQSTNITEYFAYNVGIGYESMVNANANLSGGNNTNYNVAIGYQSGENLNGTEYGVFIGSNAGGDINDGFGNFSIAIGATALQYGKRGDQNIAIGTAAGASLSSILGTTCYNINIGYRSGRSMALASGTIACDNIALGQYAGYCISSDNNVVIGKYSAFDLTTGSLNVVIGCRAACNLTTGSSNTIIGPQAGCTLTTGSNNMLLGNDSQPSSATVSNEITLGNSSISTIRAQVTSITALSDRRDKTNIKDLNVGLDFINDLKPVTFDWNTRDGSKKGKKEVGFIAQDLDEVQQKYNIEENLQIVLKSNPDKLEAAQGKLIPILVQAIKDLKKEIDELKNNK